MPLVIPAQQFGAHPPRCLPTRLLSRCRPLPASRRPQSGTALLSSSARRSPLCTRLLSSTRTREICPATRGATNITYPFTNASSVETVLSISSTHAEHEENCQHSNTEHTGEKYSLPRSLSGLLRHGAGLRRRLRRISRRGQPKHLHPLSVAHWSDPVCCLARS